MSLQDVMNKLRNEGVNISNIKIKMEDKPEVKIMEKIEEVIVEEQKVISTLQEVEAKIEDNVIQEVSRDSKKGVKRKLIPSLVGGNLSNIYTWVCENPNITVEDCVKRCNEFNYTFKLQSVKDYWRVAQTIIQNLKNLNKLKE